MQTNGDTVKYFFLSDDWTTGRVWEFGGEWNEQARRRRPYLQKQSLCIQENGETLWLFQTEDDVLMLEVKPKVGAQTAEATIGQVVLKRLLSADQVIERLCKEDFFHKGGAHNATADRLGLSGDTLHPVSPRSVLNEYDEQLLPEAFSASAQL